MENLNRGVFLVPPDYGVPTVMILAIASGNDFILQGNGLLHGRMPFQGVVFHFKERIALGRKSQFKAVRKRFWRNEADARRLHDVADETCDDE
jgi:hypothetical protein